MKEKLSHNNEESKNFITDKNIQLKEREELWETWIRYYLSKTKLEDIVTKLNIELKFEKSTTILDEILNHQRSPFDKARLGYDQKTYVEGLNSIMQKGEEEPKSYVAFLKDSIKNEENDKKINDN